MSQLFKHNFFVKFRLAFFVIFPIILLALPSDYFDTGQSICLSVLIFKEECYGCGMTRALMHLVHFDVQSAIYYNALSLLVLPILMYVWARWFWKSYQQLNEMKIK